MIYIKNSLKRKKRKTEDGYDVWKWRRKKTARKPIAVSSVWTWDAQHLPKDTVVLLLGMLMELKVYGKSGILGSLPMRLSLIHSGQGFLELGWQQFTSKPC